MPMRTFAQKKPKAPQQTGSAASATSRKALFGNDIAERPPEATTSAVAGSTIDASRIEFDFGRISVHVPAPAPTKLALSKSGTIAEQEANRVARQVMSMPNPQRHSDVGYPKRIGGQSDHGHVQTRRGVANDSVGTAVPPVVYDALRSSGRPLDPTTRAFMEPRFGADFSRVRVHADSMAAAATHALRANAFTVGSHLVFGSGRYAPATQQGKSLIAHELTHTLQQNSTAAERVQCDHYTPAERTAMAEGRVKGQADDLALAAKRGFVPGDIIFRLGSVALGYLTGEPVTHGGIYVGDGLIHDVVAFGNRHVRVSNFFDPSLGEAANASTYGQVRFKGPLHDLIVGRLLANIARRDFRMPTDPVPFNLFSSAGDYKTATCLEYTHAQFLYAIRQLSVDQTVAADDRATLRKTYFTGNEAEPNALIKPQEQRLIGDTPDIGGMSGGGMFGSQPSRSPSAKLQEGLLNAAATAAASDVDPKKFSNRSESQYNVKWPGGPGLGGDILNFIAGPSYDEVVLQTFTYKSFVDSRQFFDVVHSP
jgi:Domain of unknown function (DUF4157)